MDINTDLLSHSRTMEPEVTLRSSLGLDVIMAPGSNAGHLIIKLALNADNAVVTLLKILSEIIERHILLNFLCFSNENFQFSVCVLYKWH